MGAGVSGLVDALALAGYTHVEAVDISQAAVVRLQERLRAQGLLAVCRRADVRTVQFDAPIDLWHDRAVFHFLTDPADQATYAARAAAAVRPGGHLLVASFAMGGPEQCSGLAVQQHDEVSLIAVFGASFELIESFHHNHLTPWGAEQRFIHTIFHRRPD